ncbi:MAG TPA: hypothetical protein PL012_18345, partial [Candidatus Obscuribacter sp.]|nr:hypothetical protein [Candidatus Obscuribacter sp.]
MAKRRARKSRLRGSETVPARFLLNVFAALSGRLGWTASGEAPFDIGISILTFAEKISDLY